jgi:hypothetical protein
MDEAGYGPNLGPLVVAATVWEIGDCKWRMADGGLRHPVHKRKPAVRMPPRGLYDVLAAAVAGESCTDGRVAIADSKTLYHPGGGLRQLERGVHAALAAIERPATRWSRLVEALAADPAGRRQELPWHADFDCRLPVDASADEVTPLGARFSEATVSAGVRPIALWARLVFPAEFNELVERFDGKGAALSHVTIGLLREIVDWVRGWNDGGKGTHASQPARATMRSASATGASPLFAVCDKHGGRNHYAALLQHHFSEHWIEPLLETRDESRYNWGPADAPVEVAFRVRGEGALPVALASMTAKYLRELAMRAWNEFWCARVPGLRPTAGYPADAPRFKAEIDREQRRLKIDDRLLWRSR